MRERKRGVLFTTCGEPIGGGEPRHYYEAEYQRGCEVVVCVRIFGSLEAIDRAASYLERAVLCSTPVQIGSM